MISKSEPLFWKHRSHKGQDCVGEVFLRWIVPIMGDVTVHDGPEPLDGIEMRANRAAVGSDECDSFCATGTL